MHRCIKSISLLAPLFLAHCIGYAQEAPFSYPDSLGQRARYEIVIDMPKGSLSGIMIMHRCTDETIDASIVNEFGISMMDLTFDERREKVKFHSLTDRLNKWYIRRTLANDLKKIFRTMREGSDSYYNSKRKIKYTFHPAYESE